MHKITSSSSLFFDFFFFETESSISLHLQCHNPFPYKMWPTGSTRDENPNIYSHEGLTEQVVFEEES
jgi:hypothetical protein